MFNFFKSFKRKNAVDQLDLMLAMSRAIEVYPSRSISIDMEFWHHNIGEPIEVDLKLYIGSESGTTNSFLKYFKTLPELLAFLDSAKSA
jgi:hypothetical protein